MDRKKGIISLCVIVLVMMVVGYFLSRDDAQPQGVQMNTPLSAKMKEEILQEYKRVLGDFYEEYPLVWLDENGGKREPGVTRYFGTYGECFVTITYDVNLDSHGSSRDGPWPVPGLPRRVDYPVNCYISLYNRNPNCKLGPYHGRFESLTIVIRNDLNWLTDAQLEQLTDDLEAWLAAGNY